MRQGERPLAMYPLLFWLQPQPRSAQFKAAIFVQRKGPQGERQERRVLVPPQPPICCVTLAKPLSLSGPQFSYLYNRDPSSRDNL